MMTSQHSGISASFTAASSLAPDSSVISDNGDSDVGYTPISPSSTSQFEKKKRTSKIWTTRLSEGIKSSVTRKVKLYGVASIAKGSLPNILKMVAQHTSTSTLNLTLRLVY
ncbi:hypothetical protein BJ878DRAFT_337241 [Calycina marina]|uniref:Uncharacterized protein n=1 Tax=Calycina marina TaxID=1763456 RepID=A0A9P7YUH8_9HELO|nr:hypothetical protein BJ878DRAFT_337241 [Calycina marina]